MVRIFLHRSGHTSVGIGTGRCQIVEAFVKTRMLIVIHERLKADSSYPRKWVLSSKVDFSSNDASIRLGKPGRAIILQDSVNHPTSEQLGN